MIIRRYLPEYESAVIDLWRRCNLIRPQNNPKLDIERKLKVNPELFLVGLIDGKVVTSAIGGYEGHRGWVNYLGVDPAYRRQGLGRQMMEAVQKRLLAMGCTKINLQIRTDNLGALQFYEKIGYKIDEVVSMGKRLVND
ncbi:MAG: GNAT family acetyltransferase [Chloroflexi bacterium RBG_16_56_11]|nr:MAG: GNAT family acetyltransferase [Chloroflexi bacterium RBG_16_56_11]